jgi:hypothetical protein
MILLDSPRYDLAAIGLHLVENASAVVTAIQRSSLQQLLVGYGTKTVAFGSPACPQWMSALPKNTYLMMLLENGVAGFCLMTWLVALVIREISITARKQSTGAEVTFRLWSIAAALCGLSVAALSFTVFYNMATQLVFWGVAGVALGLCVRYGSRDHGAVLMVRFGH